MKPNDVRLTRSEEIEEIIAVGVELGVLRSDQFDLDPCAHEHRPTPRTIQKKHLSASWNGLRGDWFGDVFVNPPFSDLSSWCYKSMVELDCKRIFSVSMIVPNTTLERPCVQDLIYKKIDYSPQAVIYPLERRRPFIHPDTMEEMKRPPFGITIIYRWSTFRAS